MSQVVPPVNDIHLDWFTTQTSHQLLPCAPSRNGDCTHIHVLWLKRNRFVVVNTAYNLIYNSIFQITKTSPSIVTTKKKTNETNYLQWHVQIKRTKKWLSTKSFNFSSTHYFKLYIMMKRITYAAICMMVTITCISYKEWKYL